MVKAQKGRKGSTKASSEPKMTAEEKFVEKLVEIVEREQRLPWVNPMYGASHIPINYITRRPYRGGNVMMLIFGSGEYLTYKQVVEYNEKHKTNYRVKKGASYPVFFTGLKRAKISEQEALKMIAEGKGAYLKKIEGSEPVKYEMVTGRFTTLYWVWDIVDVLDENGKNLPSLREVKTRQVQVPKEESYNKIQGYINGYMKRENMLRTDIAGQAYYSEVRDSVNIPKIETFKTDISYFSTFVHELLHSTGHKKRLNRETLYTYHNAMTERGVEELVAEGGAMQVLYHCGIAEKGEEIAEIENSESYLQHWLTYVRKNPKEFLKASTLMFEALDYFLDVKPVEEAPREEKKTTVEERLKQIVRYVEKKKDKRGTKTYARIQKAGIADRILADGYSVAVTEMKVPVYKKALPNGKMLYVGMTFAILADSPTEYKEIYNICRESTIEDAENLAKRTKDYGFILMATSMNLRKKL